MGWDVGWASWRRAFKPAHLGYSHSGGQERLVVLGELPFTGGSHFFDDCFFNETRTSVKKAAFWFGVYTCLWKVMGISGGKRLFIQPGRSEYQVSALILEMPGCNLL